jgi:imidazolonepropionase-like amidohydrolase
LGTLASGAYADLILVNGNPLAGPSALARVTAVWRCGEPALLPPATEDGHQALGVRS